MSQALGDKQFFVTPAHDCSYLAERQATTLFLDPSERVSAQTYQILSQNGFRRSGKYLYRPHCGACQACMATRVPVAKFAPRRSQRRIARANADLSIAIEPAEYSQPHYELYARYVAGRHQEGEMFPPSVEQYQTFLLDSWSDTLFVCSYLDDQLVAVAVTDRQPDGLSAIYTYFEPTLPRRSLGVHSILQQIQLCRDWQLRYLYLGYWIRDSAKMAYKTDYRPIEILTDNRWLTLS